MLGGHGRTFLGMDMMEHHLKNIHVTISLGMDGHGMGWKREANQTADRAIAAMDGKR